MDTTSNDISSSTQPDYGDEIPLNFMAVNYTFAVCIMIVLASAAVIGTFGNILILVTVATQRQVRSVESIFVVNLACCDLYVTLVAEPLSIVAKTVGWEWFEGVPNLCRAIGSMCTMGCVGSLMTLSILSLNRYVLICHHTLYPSLFTVSKCLAFCCFIYLFGFFLVSFNFYGIGDHGFDYKSYECVWDRMANHDYTIGFSIVLVWLPIAITGLAYGRVYSYVSKVRQKAGKSATSKANVSKTRDVSSVVNAGEKSEKKGQQEEVVLNVKGWNEDLGRQGEMNRQDFTVSKVQAESVNGQDPPAANGHNDAADTESVSSKTELETTEMKSPLIRSSQVKKNSQEALAVSQTAFVRFSVPGDLKEKPAPSDASILTTTRTPTTTTSPADTQPSKAGHPGLKLARPLFIIYVVFSTCWIPYSLVIIADRSNTLPPELHAFITAFAHLNSSINWLVYYYTHSKMRQAFRNVLGLSPYATSSVRPATTAVSQVS